MAAVLQPETGGDAPFWLRQARRKLDQATRRRMGELALAPAAWPALAAVLQTAALKADTEDVIAALAELPVEAFARRCRMALPAGTGALDSIEQRLDADPASLQVAIVDALRRFDRLAFAALWRRARPDLETAAAGTVAIDAEDGVAEAIVFPSLFGAHRFRFGDVLVQTLPPEQLAARPATTATPQDDPESEDRADPEPIFHALGDATRFAIARLIAREPLTGAELARRLGVSGPTLTHHLHRLRAARLVIEERRGNRILLRLDRHAIAALSTLALETLFGTRPVALRRSRRH